MIARRHSRLLIMYGLKDGSKWLMRRDLLSLYSLARVESNSTESRSRTRATNSTCRSKERDMVQDLQQVKTTKSRAEGKVFAQSLVSSPTR